MNVNGVIMPITSGESNPTAERLNLAIFSLHKDRGFAFMNLIGSGSYGSVYRIVEPSNKYEIAIKMVLNEQVSYYEVNMWPKIRHQNILPVVDVIFLATPSVTVFVMPLLMTNLYQVMKNREFLSHCGAFEYLKMWLSQILSALEYLHSNHACHLDIKSDNILISESMSAVLCDFSFLNSTLKPIYCHEIGVPLIFRPPELLKASMNDMIDGKAVDLWCFGTMAVQALTQNGLIKAHPNENNPEEIYTSLMNLLEREKFKNSLQSTFPADDIAEKITTDTLAFVEAFLEFNAQERIAAGKAMNHPFFTGLTSDQNDVVTSQDYDAFEKAWARVGDRPAKCPFTAELEKQPTVSAEIKTQSALALKSVDLQEVLVTESAEDFFVIKSLPDIGEDEEVVDNIDNDHDNDIHFIDVSEREELLYRKGGSKSKFFGWMRKKINACRKIFSRRKEKHSK